MQVQGQRETEVCHANVKQSLNIIRTIRLYRQMYQTPSRSLPSSHSYHVLFFFVLHFFIIRIKILLFFKIALLLYAFMIHNITFDSKGETNFLLLSSFPIHDYFGIKYKCMSWEIKQKKCTHKEFVKSFWSSQKIDLNMYVMDTEYAQHKKYWHTSHEIWVFWRCW